VKIVVDTSQLEKSIDHVVNKQMPFALAKTLTDTVKDAQRALEAQLPKKLDRPTRFSLKAFGVSRATKKNLEAVIFIKDIQAEYLKYAVEGGERQPAGKAHALPAKIRLNKHGNIAGRRGGKKFEKLLAKPNTFKATIKGVHGVWQRNKKGTKVKLLIAFRPTASYEKKFPFYRIVEGVVKSRLQRNFQRAYSSALATAR
jgi:hypothetical protein